MKIYAVNRYTEFYFKSFYEPIRYDAAKLGDEQIARDASKFLAALGDPADLEYAAFLFTEERAQLFIDEVTRAGYYVPPDLWAKWIWIRKIWAEPAGRTDENWIKMIKIGQEIYGYAAAKQRQIFAGRQFWNMVRSTQAWQMCYDRALKANLRWLPRPLAHDFAVESADYFVREALKKQASLKALSNMGFHEEIMDYLERALAWIGTWVSAGALSCALAAVGLAAVAILIFNPKEWGYRHAYFNQSRYILRYKENIYWADPIAQNVKGVLIYKNCLEAAAKVVYEEYELGKPARAVDTLYLCPFVERETKVDMWFWLIWPWEMNVTFVGMGTKIAPTFWKLNDSYLNYQLEPVEQYRDKDGVIQIIPSPWYARFPPFGGMKDASEWCRVPDFDWHYQKLRFID